MADDSSSEEEKVVEKKKVKRPQEAKSKTPAKKEKTNEISA